MKPFDAILFDLDGLLIDSEPIGLRALAVYLERYGHAVPEGFAARLIGRRPLDNAALLIEHFGLPRTIEDVIAEERQLIEAMVEAECQPMPYADQLLRSLRARGIRAAVATSSLRSYLGMVLRKFGWADLLDATVTGDEVAVGKPAPDIFLRAADLVEAPPARCLVLEDAPHGVAAGLAAGAIVRAIPNSVTRDLEFPPGVLKLDSLADVMAWLDA